MEIAKQLYSYLEERLPSNQKPLQLTGETLLLEQKIIDSIGMLELVFFIQDTFAVEIPEEDITPENFATLDGLVGYVEGLVSQSSS